MMQYSVLTQLSSKGPYVGSTHRKLQVQATYQCVYYRVCQLVRTELTEILTDIYNISLSQAIVPSCFKATTIIPLPKKSPASILSIALTPIMMMCFERLVKGHITPILPAALDLLGNPLGKCDGGAGTRSSTTFFVFVHIFSAQQAN